MTIKTLSLLAILLTALSSCNTSQKQEEGHTHDDHAHDDHSSHNNSSKSPRTAAMANIGSNHVHIDYSAPSVRGREIFGGLVAWDEVWVTGAHSATSISFSEDALVEGIQVSKGKYALFTIPGKDKWTVILNSNYEQHLTDEYDEKDDLLRVVVDSENNENMTEQLKFAVIETSKGEGVVEFGWSDRKFRFKIESPM